MPLEMAELHEQALLGQATALKQFADARRARKDAKLQDLLVAQLGVSADEATGIVQRARSGDETAWQNVQQARQQRSQKK